MIPKKMLKKHQVVRAAMMEVIDRQQNEIQSLACDVGRLRARIATQESVIAHFAQAAQHMGWTGIESRDGEDTLRFIEERWERVEAAAKRHGWKNDPGDYLPEEHLDAELTLAKRRIDTERAKASMPQRLVP